MRRYRSVSDQELEYYRLHLVEALGEDGVVCLECGRVYRAVGYHIKVHGLTSDAYREIWGYNRTGGLMIPALREERRQLTIARQLHTLVPADLRLERLKAARRSSWTPRLQSRVARSKAMRARLAGGWRPPTTKADNETLRRLVAEGLTFSQVAERTGLA
jgi:hypothetical protein